MNKQEETIQDTLIFGVLMLVVLMVLALNVEVIYAGLCGVVCLMG